MNTQALERATTKTATVTVRYVNPAKAPGKSGSIKDVDGQFYGVRPNMLSLFEPDGTYDVEYTERVFNGVIYRDVKAIHPIVDAEQFRAPTPQPSRTPQQPQPQRSAPVQQPAPQNGNGNYYRPTSPQDKKSMFRCACITAAIKSRQVALTRDALAELIVEVDAAYDMAVPENLAAG